MYTVINANFKQLDALFKKHMKSTSFLGLTIPKLKILNFSYDNEDDIGFVTLETITGKTISYQLRNDEPCFVEFTGFGNIRYDTGFIKKEHINMYNLLKEYGIKARQKFWNGGDI